MRIAVVSDIHGNLDALEAVMDDLRDRAIDRVVNLGDSLAGPLLPKETAQFLMARQDWIHLAGNHERQMLALSTSSGRADIYAHSQLGAAELSWLATLPAQASIGDDVLLCHGTPGSDLVTLLETANCQASRADIEERLSGVTVGLVLCGHSHVARSVRCAGRLLVNPGSVGLQAYSDDYPFPHAIESGSPDARYAIVERRNDAWQVALISVPYDSRRMVALAELRGFPEWAHALATGYVS